MPQTNKYIITDCPGMVQSLSEQDPKYNKIVEKGNIYTTNK